MLAQAFKTAEELQLTDNEHRALITVLGMMERGEIKDYVEVPGLGRERCYSYDMQPTLFMMSHVVIHTECGTAGCIKGHAIHVGNLDHNSAFGGRGNSKLRNSALLHLFFTGMNNNVEQSAIRLREYLTTGWVDVAP